MDKTTQSPTSPAGPEEQAAFAALNVLLDYLFLNARMRDGVPMPPLFDRLDFQSFVQSCLHAPAAQWSPEQLQGLQWLASYTHSIADGTE